MDTRWSNLHDLKRSRWFPTPVVMQKSWGHMAVGWLPGRLWVEIYKITRQLEKKTCTFGHPSWNNLSNGSERFRNKSIIRAGILCHPLSTYPNIHLPSTRVSLNETCWASFRFYSNLLNLLTESHPAVAPSSVQSFFWTTVPFDFAIGHCNLVRKDERSHLVRLQELEPGNSKVSTGDMAGNQPKKPAASMCRASSRNSSKKTWNVQEILSCMAKNSWNLRYTKHHLSKTKCHSKSFLWLYSWNYAQPTEICV